MREARLDQEGTLFGNPPTEKMTSQCLQIIILLGPGCQVLLWVRSGVEVRKQSKDYSILANSPSMASLRQGNMLDLLPYSPSPEKAIAPHSNTLAWKIPWMEEPGRLQSMGSLSRTRLSDFTFTFYFHALEKAMAAHSSVLAWRIPGTGEPGGLPSYPLPTYHLVTLTLFSV